MSSIDVSNKSSGEAVCAVGTTYSSSDLDANAPTDRTDNTTQDTSSSEAAVDSNGESASGTEVDKSSHKHVDPMPPERPTQELIENVYFDLCMSFRLFSSDIPENRYRVTLLDEVAKQVLATVTLVPNSWIYFPKTYYIKYRLILDDLVDGVTVKDIVLDLADKDVVLALPGEALGDTIGWFSYFERFKEKTKCKLHVYCGTWFSDLVKKQYLDIDFISSDTKAECFTFKPFAIYRPGLYFNDDTDNQPIDFRFAGNHRTCAHILSVSPEDIPPRFDLSAERKISDKYVCIAAQGSAKAKCWNNPTGWYDVIKFLKAAGYRVLCIDKEPAQGDGVNFNVMPPGCEDFTGNLPIQERIDLIKDADFFIGLSSGLSWVAWGCNVPIVMISGFTWPTNEFYTPYRVINYNVCSGCWNDMKVQFDHRDYMWCPRHKNDDSRHICSRAISAGQVIDVIKSIPTFSDGAVTEA